MSSHMLISVMPSVLVTFLCSSFLQSKCKPLCGTQVSLLRNYQPKDGNEKLALGSWLILCYCFASKWVGVVELAWGNQPLLAGRKVVCPLPIES